MSSARSRRPRPASVRSLKQNATDINSALSTLVASVADAIRNSCAEHRAVARSPAQHHHGGDPFERAGCRAFARQPVGATTMEAIRTGAQDAGAHADRRVVRRHRCDEAERGRDRAFARPARRPRRPKRCATSADEATRKIAATSGEVTGAIKRGTAEAERALTTVATGVHDGAEAERRRSRAQRCSASAPKSRAASPPRPRN